MWITRAMAIGAAVVGLSAAAAGSGIGETPDCEARLTPDRLTLSSRPVRILAETPRSVGELEEVIPSPRSGISVLGVEEDRPTGSAWILELDLREASAGDWRLTLEGSEIQCAGRLQLREAGMERDPR